MDKKALNWENIAYKNALELDNILNEMDGRNARVKKARQYSYNIKEALSKSVRTEQQTEEDNGRH